jgi:hypothetical protein
MNERIKLLALQAGMVIIEDRFSTYLPFVEKFAELIVRECIDTAFHRGHPDLEFLLKHFEVEE